LTGEWVCSLFNDALSVTRWNTRRCSGFKIKLKKSSD
jgi:hypothetical protein